MPSRRTAVPSLLAAVSLSLTLLSVPYRVYAQAQDENTFFTPPQTLAQALKYSVYDPVRRPPLILVAAETTPASRQDEVHEALWHTDWQQHPALGQIAGLFDRRLTTLDTVAVLAPTQMAVFADPTKFHPEANIPPDRALMLLAASLKPAQWERLASAQGLGMADLSAEQCDWMRVLLPRPLMVKCVIGAENGGYSDAPPAQGGGGPVPVEEAALEGLRLRVHRSLSWMFAPKSGESLMTVGARPPSDPARSGQALYDACRVTAR